MDDLVNWLADIMETRLFEQLNAICNAVNEQMKAVLKLTNNSH